MPNCIEDNFFEDEAPYAFLLRMNLFKLFNSLTLILDFINIMAAVYKIET